MFMGSFWITFCQLLINNYYEDINTITNTQKLWKPGMCPGLCLNTGWTRNPNKRWAGLRADRSSLFVFSYHVIGLRTGQPALAIELEAISTLVTAMEDWWWWLTRHWNTRAQLPGTVFCTLSCEWPSEGEWTNEWLKPNLQ